MTGRKRAPSPSPVQGKGSPRVSEAWERESAPSTTSLGRLRAPPFPAGGEGKESLVLLGEFGRAHGLKGEARLKSFTADPAAIASYGPLMGAQGRRFVIKGLRPAGGGSPGLFIAAIEGVASREDAEALNGAPLYATRDQLGPPGEEDEFLAADLIGLIAETAAGELIGTIIAVPDYGGGDLLEIMPEGGGPTALLPFTKAFAPEVRLPERRITLDLPADLFETDSDDQRT